MAVYNNKQAQIVTHEKMLQKQIKKDNLEANDDTGNLDWLLRSDRTGQDGDKIQEKRLKEERKQSESNVILEKSIDAHSSHLTNRDENPTSIMDMFLPYEEEFIKEFKAAQEDGRDTSFWDKQIGVPQEKLPKVPSNVQPSQLLVNYKDREEWDKKTIAAKQDEIVTALKDADAMLYHVYRMASEENRELSAEENQIVHNINSDKIRLIAELHSYSQK